MQVTKELKFYGQEIDYDVTKIKTNYGFVNKKKELLDREYGIDQLNHIELNALPRNAVQDSAILKLLLRKQKTLRIGMSAQRLDYRVLRIDHSEFEIVLDGEFLFNGVQENIYLTNAWLLY